MLLALVPGWESSVTIAMDNDETDAQGRALRGRTGLSLCDSAQLNMLTAHSGSLIPLGFPLYLVRGTAASSPMSTPAFSQTYDVHLSPFCWSNSE